MKVTNVHLVGPFGVSLVSDFSDFLSLSSNPSHVLEPNSTRQSRPGLIIAAAILSLPLSPLRGLAARLGVHADKPDFDPTKVSNALASAPPAFAAYLLLNIVFLAVAFGCLKKDSMPGATAGETMIVVAAGLLLLANDLVKVFLWSPHTQIFNILVPVLGVHATLRAWSDGLRDRRYAAGMGAAIGLGLTAYPLFVVLVPCLVVPALWRSLRLPWREVRIRIANVAIVVVLSVLPYLTWFLLIRFKTGGFQSREVEEGMGVWMMDAWARGAPALAIALAQRLLGLIGLAAHQAIPVAVILAWITAVYIFSGRRAQLRSVLQVAGAALFVSALVVVFYGSVGLIIERLAYPVVPALIVTAAAAGVAVAKQVSPRHGWILGGGCLAVAIVQTAVTVIKAQPFL